MVSVQPRRARPLNCRRRPDDAGDDPPLALAQRPALDDRDAVADLRGVVLVVRHELRRPALGLPVEAVPHLPLDRNDAGLLHLVADDDPFFFSLLSHVFLRSPASGFGLLTSGLGPGA